MAKPTKKGKKKASQLPFRDLERDGVTYSFLGKFLLDREQARLQYVEGLGRDGIIDALDFGSAYHELLQHFAEGSNCDPRQLRTKLDKWLMDQKKYRHLSAHDYNQVRYLTDQVCMIFPYYLQYWKQKKGHEHRSDFVCQEADFKMPHLIPWQYDDLGVPLTEPNTRLVMLRGRFDAIFRMNGRLWLMENKTKSQIDEEGLQASLSQDLQTMLYCQAIRLQYGEIPAGVLYNIIRRPGHRIGKTEQPQECIDRMERDIKDNPDKYFIRYEITFGKNDLDNWVERTLNPMLTQVCLWWDEIKHSPFDPWKIKNRVHHFINPEGLYSRYGRSEFFDYLTRGTTHGLSRRTK